MAFSGQDSNLVWQKVQKSIGDKNPAAVACFKALKNYLSQQKKNPDLQFIPFTEAEADAAGGTVKLAGAATLYAVFLKKENSATLNFFLLYDDATDDTTDANARVALTMKAANAESFYVQPEGLALATGIVVTQYATSIIGKSDGSNGGDGFILIGA